MHLLTIGFHEIVFRFDYYNFTNNRKAHHWMRPNVNPDYYRLRQNNNTHDIVSIENNNEQTDNEI